MSQANPTELSFEKGNRNRKPYALTPRALEARRANLVKARAAPKEIIYRPTAKRQAASRANILKAIAARKSAEGNRAARMNALKHGLFAHEVLAESVDRLEENTQGFNEHVALFERVYVPEDDLERKLVRRLAETTWRRLRLFHAQARWEAERLRKIFATAPVVEKLTADQTHDRAFGLMELLADHGRVFYEARRLHSKIEFLLRALLRKRSGGKIQFKVLCGRRDSRLPELEKPSTSDYLDTVLALRETAEGREALRKVFEKAGVRIPQWLEAGD